MTSPLSLRCKRSISLRRYRAPRYDGYKDTGNDDAPSPNFDTWDTIPYVNAEVVWWILFLLQCSKTLVHPPTRLLIFSVSFLLQISTQNSPFSNIVLMCDEQVIYARLSEFVALVYFVLAVKVVNNWKVLRAVVRNSALQCIVIILWH